MRVSEMPRPVHVLSETMVPSLRRQSAVWVSVFAAEQVGFAGLVQLTALYEHPE